MKKVLLLSCLISMAAQAGTGGGTSTPPAKAGLAKSIALAIGLGGDSGLRSTSAQPLPIEFTIEVDSKVAPNGEQSNTVEVSDLQGATRSYRIFDGEQADEVILKDRRENLRASILR